MRASLAVVLNGGPLPDGLDSAALVRFAIAQGVGPLLAAAPAAGDLQGEAAALIAEDARLDVLHAALINDELRRVLAALHGAGLRAVVVKGAHLAHAVYPRPDMRVRSDSDLFIDPADRSGVERVLIGCGYVRPVHVRGLVILGQFHLSRQDRADVTHALDIHWRVAAPLLVERLLPARLVRESAEPLPALSPHAWAPSLPHALACACLHLAAHHWHAPDLLWLHDLRVLGDALSPAQIRLVVELTGTRRFSTLVARVLDAARQEFPSASLDAIIAALPCDPSEDALKLLARRRTVDDFRLDLRYATGAERLGLIREHLFPDRDYIKASNGGRPLAAAYARRIARGARRWLTRQG